MRRTGSVMAIAAGLSLMGLVLAQAGNPKEIKKDKSWFSNITIHEE